MRRGAWVAVPAALLLLAGCSAPEPANDTLPTAASTSASPTLEPLGPADFPVPDEAREQTEAGAEAMARYYLDLIDYGRSRMDGQPFLDLSSGCETCQQLAGGFAAEKSAGNSYEGADLSIATIESVSLDGPTADLVLTMRQAPSTLRAPDGSEIPGRSTAEVRLSGGMVLEWDSIREGWIVEQLNAEQY